MRRASPLVLTAADLAAGTDWFQPIGPDGLAKPAYPPLADGKVRFAGEAVVMVVAESRALAEDACELVELDIEPLVPITGIADALDPSLPPLFDDVGTNVFFRDERTYGDPDGAFARADRVVRLHIANQRMANVPLEGRAGLAVPGPGPGELTYHVAHQNPHAVRATLSTLMREPLDRFTIRCGDIGGSFGQKAYTMREDVCVCVAARRLGRPVKWIEDRVENLLAAGHARDDVLDVEAAVTVDGTILGVRVHMTVDQGAYQLVTLASTVVPDARAGPVPERVPHPRLLVRDDRRRDQQGDLRGLPRPVGVRDVGARTPARRHRRRARARSGRGAAAQPLHARRAPDQDGDGPDAGVRDRPRDARARASRSPTSRGSGREQAAARREGRYLGIGFATFIEASPGPPDYGAALGASASPRTAQSAGAAARDRRHASRS